MGEPRLPLIPGRKSVGPASVAPAPLRIPRDHDGTQALPLVVLLHGYTLSAAWQDGYFGLSDRADEDGYFLLLPDGTREASAARNRFWNAIPGSCCNWYGSDVDDESRMFAMHGQCELFYDDQRW